MRGTRVGLSWHSSLNAIHYSAVWNSGAEAVEAAVKLARHATGKQNIIVVQGSYHGRTFGTMALTKSKTIYGAGYAPLMVSCGPQSCCIVRRSAGN